MLEKNLDIIYNKKYLVIVPQMSKELLDSFEYSFGNTILITTDVDDKKNVINFINKNNFNKIIFVDYQIEYEDIIKSIHKNMKYDFIFTKSLASFSNSFIYNTYKLLYSLYKRNPKSKLGILDYGLFKCLNNNDENVKHIVLDIKKDEKVPEIKNNFVGILNSEDDSNHSFYNELSAIKLINNSTVNILKCGKKTKKFLKIFKINNNKKRNLEDIIESSEVNLYINFTDNNILIFLRSMDKGIPCILGNSDILDENKYLKDMLVMKSDDNIDEIAERIKNVSKNKEKILKEYEKFRNKYTLKSKEKIESFLELKLEKDKIKNDEDILITVIVPVYNTYDYLRKLLDSIIKASLKNMEILIINDGSTDDSEKIILQYQKKYPKLIRYIKQKNHGLGNVRNVGLKEARGKYIASIDSDDTINKKFFISSLDYLRKNIDIVMYDWLTISNDGLYQTSASDYIFQTPEFNRYEAILYTSIMPSTCNKIIKKSLFEDLNLTYIEDKYEDLSANPFVLLKAETIKYINKGYYEYYIRSNSIMRTKAGYSMIDVIKLVDERVKKYKENINVDIEKFKYYTYSWRIEEYVFNQLYAMEEKEIKDYIDYIYLNIKNLIGDIFKNYRYDEMLMTLKDDDRKYIMDRNIAFNNMKLEEFIKNAREKNKIFKITPPIIYYGYKEN